MARSFLFQAIGYVRRKDVNLCLTNNIQGVVWHRVFCFCLGGDLLYVSYNLWHIYSRRSVPWKFWVFMILVTPKNSQLAVLVKKKKKEKGKKVFSFFFLIQPAEISGRIWLNSLKLLPFPELKSNWGWGGGGERIPRLEKSGFHAQFLSQEVGSALLEPCSLECNESCPAKSNWQD